MKRKPRFLIAIASAIVTIGILAATVGKPKHFDKRFDKHHPKMECSRTCEPSDSTK